MSLLPAVLLLSAMGLSICLLLSFTRLRLKSSVSSPVDLIMRELPQTQCAQCGYPGCRPYAEAILKGEEINRCPPGGDTTVVALSRLLGRERIPLDLSGGDGVSRTAVIREQDCVGCALCLPACPVDAILGAPQQMHTVIQQSCTGCELCLAPCPVDCIDMLENEQSGTRDREPWHHLPCIHCGECIPVCPRSLAPQRLLQHIGDAESLVQLNLSDCIECGLCDRVCPSDIPLASYFVLAKADLNRRLSDQKEAQLLLDRVVRHEARFTTGDETPLADPADLIAGLKADRSGGK